MELMLLSTATTSLDQLETTEINARWREIYELESAGDSVAQPFNDLFACYDLAEDGLVALIRFYYYWLVHLSLHLH